MTPLISVIVPVYQSEKTLNRCVESILAQSYTDFELILVDDGSVDHSGEICDQYSIKDTRIIVVHKENGGVSSARNAGLNIATGKYISFIDSDDTVEADYLKTIVDAFLKDKAQIVFFGINRIDPTTNIVFTQNIPKLPANTVERVITLTKADLFGYTVIKAISRELIGFCRFDESLNLFEDEVFTCQIMQKQPVISLIEKPLYNQIVQTGSLSRKTHADYYRKCEAVYLAWKNLLCSMRVANHPILQEKADHMTNMCKYYYLERDVPPIRFARALGKCAFFKNSSVDDILIKALKNERIEVALIIRIFYRAKNKLNGMIGR